MLKINFSLKRNPGKKGIVRLKSVSSDKDRCKNGQLVLTSDGLGTIKEYMIKKDERGRIIDPHHLLVNVRNLRYKSRTYKASSVNVIDIIDNKTGDKYPANESDYSFLLADQSPVEFIISRKGKAILTSTSRKKLDGTKIFVKKQNGIRILNELIEKGLWPIKK
jgi:hypothetical protein